MNVSADSNTAPDIQYDFKMPQLQNTAENSLPCSETLSASQTTDIFIYFFFNRTIK